MLANILRRHRLHDKVHKPIVYHGLAQGGIHHSWTQQSHNQPTFNCPGIHIQAIHILCSQQSHRQAIILLIHPDVRPNITYDSILHKGQLQELWTDYLPIYHTTSIINGVAISGFDIIS